MPGAGSPAATCDRHMDLSTSLPEAPDRRRRLVAQRRAVADRENRRHLGPEPCSRGSHLVDAVVSADEPSGFHSPRDPTPSNPRTEKLRRRDDAVLSGGECHHGVHFCIISSAHGTWVQKRTVTVRFCIIPAGGRRMMQKCTVGRHGPRASHRPDPSHSSMPQFVRRRHTYATEIRSTAPNTLPKQRRSGGEARPPRPVLVAQMNQQRGRLVAQSARRVGDEGGPAGHATHPPSS